MRMGGGETEMYAPIFSPQRYVARARSVLGTGTPTRGLTEKYYDGLVTEFEEDLMHCINEKRSTMDYANDIILMDNGVAALALPSFSGFVTVKLVGAVKCKNPHHVGVTYMPSPVSSCRNVRSTSIDGVSSALGPRQLALTTPSGVHAPMTPIITCRLATWSWPMTLSFRGISIDTQAAQHLREALVVPVNTMRLLGAEEAATVCFEFHDEQVVKSAESVVFTLTSEDIGGELSVDDYLRHFIAPFFLRHRRAISLGEEFELKNHSHGDLHVTVVAINDGHLRCGLVADDTSVRLVVHPEPPPALQGCGSEEVYGRYTLRGASASARKSISLAKDAGYLSHISNGSLEVSPRPNAPCDVLPRGVPPRASKDHTPGRGRPPRVHEPSPRKAARSVEPHSSTELPALCPQEVEKGGIFVVGTTVSGTSIHPMNEMSLDEASNLKGSFSCNGAIVATLASSILSEEHKSEGVKTTPTPDLTLQDMTEVLAKTAVTSCRSNLVPEEMHSRKNFGDFVLHLSKTPAEAEGEFSYQGDLDTCYGVPRGMHQESMQSEINGSFNDRASSVRSVVPHVPSLSEGTGSCKEIELAGLSERVPLQACPMRSSLSTQHTAHSDGIPPASVQRNDEPSEWAACDVHEDAVKTPHHVVMEEVLCPEKKQEGEGEPEFVTNPIGGDTHDDQLERKASAISLYKKCDVCTQYEVVLSIETPSLDAHPDVESHVNTGELYLSTPPVEVRGRLTQDATKGFQEYEGERANSATSLTHTSNTPTCHETPRGAEQLPKHVVTRGVQIIHEWLAVKEHWRKMPISTLLKSEPYIIIEKFQHFIAVYKELKQRHGDCLAYLDSPYAHTLRGGMVLRISPFPQTDNEVNRDGAADRSRASRRSYYGMSSMRSGSEKVVGDVHEFNSETQSALSAVDLLKVSLHDVSMSLGCSILHVFRVGGTCPSLYCTLAKPYNRGPGETMLLGEPFVVDVLPTTIIEDLCEAREESRHEWAELSMVWTDAISTVLRLGIFAKHLQTVRELFWELALLLGHPGEIQHSGRLWGSVSQLYHHRNNGDGNGQHEVDDCNGGKDSKTTAAGGSSQTLPVPLDENTVTTRFTGLDSFTPYLQEMQDTYYLFSELLEPFALHSLQQLGVVSAMTDVRQCEQLMKFLRASYQVQLTEKEELECRVSVQSAAAEEERVAFLALVDAQKAGALTLLPNEWWEGGNHILGWCP